LALLDRSVGDYESALQDHAELLKAVAHDPELKNTSDFAKALSAQAELLRSMGRVSQARAAYAESRGAFRRLFPGDSAEVASEIGNEAEFLRSIGDSSGAAPLYE